MPLPDVRQAQTQELDKTTIHGCPVEFLMVESCDFESFPAGGTLNSVKQMLRAFPGRVALAGATFDDKCYGKWTSRSIAGVRFPFYGFRVIRGRGRTKPIIPHRIASYVALRKHLPRIREINTSNLLTRTPEVLLACSRYDWNSLCFSFAGTSNSVSISRYPWLRALGPFYERQLFHALYKTADVVLAAADRSAIEKLESRSKRLLARGTVKFFPTRYDPEIFSVKSQPACRAELGIPIGEKVIVSIGRLSWVKGWNLLLAALRILLSRDSSWQLTFVGDGEDRDQITREAESLMKNGRVRITGRVDAREVAKYLNAADVCAVGSHHEGWSTAMVEALACGKPIAATDVSGSRDLIRENENGIVLSTRSSVDFAFAIEKCLRMPRSEQTSVSIAARYSSAHLNRDLREVWPVIQ